VTRPARRPAEAGYALAEALIAAAIIAAALGATYEAVQTNVRAATQVQDQRQAALLGQSKLAELGSVIPLVPGSSAGRDGAFAWRVDIGTYGERNARDDGPPLLAIAVRISRAGEDRALLTLRTLRVVA